MSFASERGVSPVAIFGVRPATWAKVVVTLLLLELTAGCGSGRLPMAAVQGKVTYRGKPLEFGNVVFQPQTGGRTASGPIQPDGTFRLSTYGRDDGVVLGKHLVLVTCYEHNRPGSAPPDPSKEIAAGKSLIPPIYSTMNSPLTVEVTKGVETLTLELTGAPATERPR